MKLVAQTPRLLLLAATLVAMASFFVHDAPAAQAQETGTPGALDTSFGTGGKITADFRVGEKRTVAAAE